MRIPRSLGWLVLGVAIATPTLAVAQNDTPDCVTVDAMPRWGASGYDHWVRIRNGCEHAVRCSVRTNVNPDATQVTVAAGATEEVLTWRGSPARTFTPRVSCAER